ncbi:hypothetical protein [Ruegeria sp.]|uniref:hypothetical protein n=1 Tax=Ruegeria sp. TaxID=1879320 RepID=UPI00231D9CE4|nr:hypothetical protein [Ruegeria sp.]MDA7964867.1 hypothetical protein [Ruegeria sp.]
MTRLSSIALAAILAASSAAAGSFATQDEIKTAMSDHTYQGGMLSGAFTEYYAPDGTIKGDGYSGVWKATDHGMCFTYGTDPENCWDLKIEGAAVTLFKDGNVDGAGVVVKGNPNGF